MHVYARLLVFAFLLTACRDLFQFSPYEIRLGASVSQLTEKNLSLLAQKSSPVFTPFRFAVLADTHEFRDEVDDVVESINRDPTIMFVVVLGDITNDGLRKEYLWINELFSELRVPYLVVIGNHDALTNGKELYKSMFGVYNYAFAFNNVWFVLFNDNNWEFDNNVPDFVWLEQQLAAGGAHQHRIMGSHIGPKTRRFSAEQLQRIEGFMDSYDVGLYMFGHDHSHHITEYQAESGHITLLLNNGSALKPRYTVVNVSETEITFERVKY